jgi:flagellum-specific ATP synthase
MNDPIGDAVRSILDGHIVLTRELATQNHYPAIDVLQSVSRLNRDLCDASQLEIAGRTREALATYHKNKDLIQIGAYPAGSDPGIDRAIRLNLPINEFLKQAVTQGHPAAESWSMLEKALIAPPLLPKTSPGSPATKR